MNIKKTCMIGGGVIGGGWAARFLLHGIDVTVCDPNPATSEVMDKILANAEHAYQELYGDNITKGSLVCTNDMESALAGADIIIESVPERLDIKRDVYQQIERYASETALIGSSTSNIKPSVLQETLSHPERCLVAHPFNPVYLLPLCEVVPGQKTSEETIKTFSKILTDIGMKPLLIRKELDGHIGNRFLEAVWREALWMVKEGVATTEELDDIIRFGWGLRFAQMGQFESYRIAGGEGGMKHFIGQFGPTLKDPLTKLTDVPELDDQLVDDIATQSDNQSGKYSIRELERIRDKNLVGILLALKENDWGAGTTLKIQA